MRRKINIEHEIDYFQNRNPFSARVMHEACWVETLVAAKIFPTIFFPRFLIACVPVVQFKEMNCLIKQFLSKLLNKKEKKKSTKVY